MIRQLIVASVLFLIAALGLGLGWMNVAPTVYAVLDDPVAELMVGASDDIVWINRDDQGPVVVLENNIRKRVSVILASTGKLMYPVMGALLISGIAWPAARRRLLSRSAAWRLPATLLILVAFHITLAVMVAAYVAALENRGTIPPLLRLTGLFTDVVQPFVPFALFAALFRPWERD